MKLIQENVLKLTKDSLYKLVLHLFTETLDNKTTCIMSYITVIKLCKVSKFKQFSNKMTFFFLLLKWTHVHPVFVDIFPKYTDSSHNL